MKNENVIKGLKLLEFSNINEKYKELESQKL